MAAKGKVKLEARFTDKHERLDVIGALLNTRSNLSVAAEFRVSEMSVRRWRKTWSEEDKRKALARHAKKRRVDDVQADTDVVNEERMDVSRTYDTLARRVERLITKAEDNDDDAFALAAMEGLRKVLRDVAQLQGKLATNLTVQVTLSESEEWIDLRKVLLRVCEEVPAAREPLLRHMREKRLSITQETGDAL
jgi:hypothetical protein